MAYPRVFVTGATGHVGRIVVDQLAGAGVPVRAMTRRQGGFAAANADFLLGFSDYQGAGREPASVRYPGDPTTTRRPTAFDVTSNPARTFAQWARDHAADFRAESGS